MNADSQSSLIDRLRPTLVCGLLLITSTVAVWPVVHHWFTRPSRKVVQHDFDHLAILSTARNMMDAIPKTSFGWSSNSEYSIDDSRIPKVIRDLRPTHVNVRDDHVQIEFAGGFEHYGLYAYREGIQDRFGCQRELIEGLWYYSD